MAGVVPGIDPVSDRGKLGTESAAAAVGAVKGTSDVAWRFEPVGALAAAGGGDVAREAFVNPELVFAVDPGGMPAASTAGWSGSAGAGIATSGGGPGEADPRSDSGVLRGAPLIPSAASTRTAGCCKRISIGKGWVGAVFGTEGGEKIAFADLSRSALCGRRSAPLVVAWSTKDPLFGTSSEPLVAASMAIASISAAGYLRRNKPVAPIARIAAAAR